MYQVDNIVRIYLNAKCVSLIAQVYITYITNKTTEHYAVLEPRLVSETFTLSNEFVQKQWMALFPNQNLPLL